MVERARARVIERGIERQTQKEIERVRHMLQWGERNRQRNREIDKHKQTKKDTYS